MGASRRSRRSRIGWKEHTAVIVIIIAGTLVLAIVAPMIGD